MASAVVGTTAFSEEGRRSWYAVVVEMGILRVDGTNAETVSKEIPRSHRQHADAMESFFVSCSFMVCWKEMDGYC